eukprot:jgi/Mesvir1/2994/Mv06891-RA.3
MLKLPSISSTPLGGDGSRSGRNSGGDAGRAADGGGSPKYSESSNRGDDASGESRGGWLDLEGPVDDQPQAGNGKARGRRYPGYVVEPFHPPSIATTTWQQQGKVFGAGQQGGAGMGSGKHVDPKFRSSALYYEVKLKEALHNGEVEDRKRNGSVLLEDKRPNEYKTSVCAQLLSEMCEMTGPFSGVLTSIRDELARAVYSDYYVTNDGDQPYKQVPYFSVVAKLEEEKRLMEEERDKWAAELLERAKDVKRIEDRMKSLDADLVTKENEKQLLNKELEVAADNLARAKAESRNSRDEMKRLRKEMQRLKDEFKEALASSVSAAAEEAEAMRLRVESAEHDCARATADLAMERASNTRKVAREELDAALAKIQEQATALEEMAEQTAELRAELALPRTPRPEEADWPPGWEVLLFPNGRPEGTGTRAVVQQMWRVIGELQEQLRAAKEEVATANATAELAVHLVFPEPLPSAELMERAGTESMVQGGEVEGAEEALPRAGIAVLGLGSHVPRFLRCNGHVKSRAMTRTAVESAVAELWAWVDADDRNRGGERLGIYEAAYAMLLEQHGGDHMAAAEAGYNLVVGVKRFAHVLDVGLLYKVLSGHLPMDVRADRSRMVEGLKLLMATVEARQGKRSETKGYAETVDVIAALEAFFPAKSPKAFAALRELVTAQAQENMVKLEELVSPEVGAGPLVEVVCEQHVAEIQEYIHGLEQELRLLGSVAQQRRQQGSSPTEGSGQDGVDGGDSVPLSDIQGVLLR